MSNLRNAALDALVAIVPVSSLDKSHERMTPDEWADLRAARRSLIAALRLDISDEDLSPLAIINHLAERLTLDPHTRAIGDKIQQAALPAIMIDQARAMAAHVPASIAAE